MIDWTPPHRKKVKKNSKRDYWLIGSAADAVVRGARAQRDGDGW